jgi:hypothetical protein
MKPDQASRSGFDRATRSLRLKVLVENTKQKKSKTERQLALRNALTTGSGTDFVTGKASNDSVAPVRLPVAAEDFRCYAWTLARTGRSHP